MSLNIKNHEAERLARQLAAVTGESVTGAIAVAVRERLDRVRLHNEEAADERAARLRAIVDDAKPRWIDPHRSTDHGAVLYDEAGLPR